MEVLSIVTHVMSEGIDVFNVLFIVKTVTANSRDAAKGMPRSKNPESPSLVSGCLFLIYGAIIIVGTPHGLTNLRRWYIFPKTFGDPHTTMQRQHD